jgi:hypothetical protein
MLSVCSFAWFPKREVAAFVTKHCILSGEVKVRDLLDGIDRRLCGIELALREPRIVLSVRFHQ